MIQRVLSAEQITLIEKYESGIFGYNNVELIGLTIALFARLQPANFLVLIAEDWNGLEMKNELGSYLSLWKVDREVFFVDRPFTDPLISAEIKQQALIEAKKALRAISSNKPVVIFAYPSSLGTRISLKDEFASPFKVYVGQQIGREELINRLERFAYNYAAAVEKVGEFSFRGNIVDLFPADSGLPLRIELFGDQIRSLRLFSVETQRSWKILDQWNLFAQNRSENIFQTAKNLQEELCASCRTVFVQREEVLLSFQKFLQRFDQLLPATDSESLRKYRQQLEAITLKISGIVLQEFVSIEQPRLELEKLSLLWNQINDHQLEWLLNKKRAGYRLFFGFADSETKFKAEELLGQLESLPIGANFSLLNERKKIIIIGRARNLISEEKIAEQTEWTEDLTPGELVVHRDHGIGRYVGMEKIKVENFQAEFLKILYRQDEALYVPVYEMDALKPYRHLSDLIPQLDRLGGQSWKQKKARAKKTIISFARELLELYARRQSIRGHSYPRLEEMEALVEESFPYLLTSDQRRALAEVYTDLEMAFPMKRLVCGDVSFGKTEIALRAAVRVVANGRMVVLLAPTTILAFQHLQTFQQRLRALPIRVEMLSSWQGRTEKEQILKRIESGGIDILIGTHSVLSSSINLNNLGLLIIDEEQRFGVFQKEKILQKQPDIDLLMLSATPIPRTLSLALAGLEDVSTLQRPPIGRRAIKNYIGIFDRQTVQQAVNFELKRGGSVFFIYNRVEKMEEFCWKLAEWFPGERIEMLHARMSAGKIERVLRSFLKKEFFLLVASTIIENGIDIPAVNTMIIVDAQNFGLTQLYQLRGRIGRGDQQAYAYFLFNTDWSNLTHIARQRLEAIREFSDLGSGYRIARHDLMLRGAGSLLGNKQHGHIEALGFDYYLELIRKTVAELQGEFSAGDTEIRVYFPHTLSEELVADLQQRVKIYRQIASAERVEQLYELHSQFKDYFGSCPPELENLLLIAAARIFARRFRLKRVEIFSSELVFFVDSQKPFEILKKQNTEFIGFRFDWKYLRVKFKDWQRLFFNPALFSSLFTDS